MHLTKLVVNLDFKKQSKISVTASLISGIMGIILAYSGYGLWVFSFNDSLKITYKHNIIMEFNKLVTKN